MGIPYEAKKALIPLPKFNIVERKLNRPKPEKWELKGYNFKYSLDSPNFGILFKILPDILATNDDFFPDIQPREKPDKLRDSLKNYKLSWLKTIRTKHVTKSEVPSPVIPDIFKNESRNKMFKAMTTQPLIVGLGEASPYETGITLDFLTGLPIIPGSALKGITRRAAIMKLSGKTDLLPYGGEFAEVAKEYERHERMIQVFGTQDQKGKVIFMDAYPIEWPNGLFRVDIMNPHYGPYYESKGNNPPGDWYNPVPVPYLTVNIGVTYRFILLSQNGDLLKKAYEWFEFALENIGVGAKGNQGYGVFKILK